MYIIAYVMDAGISSNYNNKHFRNWIKRKFIELLEEIVVS